MLKFKLKKLETKLMFNEKNLTFFERLFKNQIRVLIKWYLYPEFRRGNLFVKLIESEGGGQNKGGCFFLCSNALAELMPSPIPVTNASVNTPPLLSK